jgi:uncharacterized protein (TIGR03435 family)
MRLIAIASLGAALLWAQSGRRAFDVASIKPSKDGNGGSFNRTPGQLTVTDGDFEWLIQMAYQTRQVDLSRVPDSLRSERFDIIGKAANKISGDEYWEMLQVLLEDRFKLAYHRDAREARFFALVVDQKVSAKRGADLGPKLTRSPNADCPVNPDGRNFCGVSPVPGRMIGQRVTMARIARELSPFAGGPVLDETGLAGAFDFGLTWTPDPGLSNGDGDKPGATGKPGLTPSGPSFLAAIQQQLGLKLEAKKGPIEILVIDRAEPPSEN